MVPKINTKQSKTKNEILYLVRLQLNCYTQDCHDPDPFLLDMMGSEGAEII